VNVKTRHCNRQASVAVCEWTASHNYNYNSNIELQNLVVPRNFLEFREIPRQRPNSTARLEIPRPVENCSVVLLLITSHWILAHWRRFL